MDCEEILRQALGRGMTEEEVLDFAEQGRRLARLARSGRSAAEAGARARELARGHVAGRELELAARRRAADLQRSARLRALNHVLDDFGGMEWEGLSAMLVGGKHARRGARLSVDAMRGGLAGRYVGGLIADLESLGDGAWRLFRKGKIEREIMEAMHSLDNPDAPAFAGPREAGEIAKVIHKWQEVAREDENAAGAWIGKLPGYIMRQCHDADRIRRAGLDAWSERMLASLDWQRTADGALAAAGDGERREFLARIYDNLVSGMHGSSAAGDALTRPAVVGSVAARASQPRVLHFKSGSAFYEYNRQFGRGSLIDGILSGLERSAADTALMRVLGPSPQANMDNIIRSLKQIYRERGDVGSIRKLGGMTTRLNNQMKELDGSLNQGGNPTFAEVARCVRALQSMAKLGGALISGFSDIPLMAQEFHYQGAGYFRSMAEGLRLFAKGRGSLEERRILSACGVFMDSMAGSLSARFAGQDGPGKIAGMMNLFFRLNGLGFWSDSWKKAATLMMSHDLASLANTPWASLSDKRRRVLSLYNLDENIWDMLRARPMSAADGRAYFTPELAEAIPAAELQASMQARGMLVSDERVAAFRADIADRLRSYFRDRVQYAILEPDARTAAIIHQGQAAGTTTGELLRFCLQFKSFPIAFLQRTLNREIYGRGADTAAAGLLNAVVPRNGELGGLAGMIFMTTVFGYLSMTCKELLAGKEPRALDTPENFARVFTASFIQGGGAGIYGDFLFGEKSRVGNSFLSTLAGPTIGAASSLVRLWQSARDGEDVESQAFRTAWSQLPGNNLFWIRPALDHMLLYSMYEFMNPGYVKRMRKRVLKENNQRFWIEPHTWNWARHRKKKRAS